MSHIADRAKEEEISVGTLLTLSLLASPCMCVCLRSHTPLPLLLRMSCVVGIRRLDRAYRSKGGGQAGRYSHPSPGVIVAAHGFPPSSDHC